MYIIYIYIYIYMCVYNVLGDSMAIHAGQQFSTRDRDNDKYSASCAVRYKGAWWYNGCFDVNINGLYIRNNPDPRSEGVAWEQWREYYSFKYVDMKLRPAACLC